jgi:four helix bundle protein
MDAKELSKRLQLFAIRILKMAETIPLTAGGKAIKNQIVRSGTSPGANYRAACLAKSKKDFINKLKMVEEELDETVYWLEIITLLELIKQELLKDLYNEAKELFSIISRSIKTSKQNEQINKSVNP